MPPDLPEATGLSSVVTNVSSRSAGAGDREDPAKQENGTEHSSTSCTSTNAETGGSHPPSAAGGGCKMYYITPQLRDTFASIGAVHKPYQFREVLQMLKTYLYSNRSLFDPQDIHYVNCGSDSLGKAFEVNRFHFNDVRTLVAKNLIPVESRLQIQPVTQKQAPDGSLSPSNNIIKDSVRTQSTANVNSNVDTTNDKTETGVSEAPVSTVNTQSGEASAEPLTLPGSSRSSQRAASGNRRSKSFATLYKFCIPEIPDTNSESETDYSCQGYETAYCRNTEFEESSSETDCYIDEYEIASFDEQEQKQSDEGDSDIEDVEVAVFAIHTLCQDDSEQGFWADDSQTESQSTDSDPELVAERWNCLSCGLRNKPFVRYCGKCWQLRKDWLPERSKKRKRRKPRPKKKAKKLKEQTEEQKKTQEPSSEKTSLSGDVAGPSHTKEVLLISGTLETPPTGSLDRYGSQDSGIFMSQESLNDFSNDPATSNNAKTELGPSEFVKPEGRSPLSRQLSLPSSCDNGDNKTRRKRRSSLSLEVEMPPSKASKSSDWPGKEESQNDEADARSEEFIKFLQSSAGKKCFLQFLQSKSGKDWLRSDGKLFQWSQPVQETCMEALGTSSNSGLSGRCSPETISGLSLMCSICCLRPKNASIIHGRLSHQATCYQCARRLLDSGGRCPVCRRKIHMVCKHIIA